MRKLEENGFYLRSFTTKKRPFQVLLYPDIEGDKCR